MTATLWQALHRRHEVLAPQCCELRNFTYHEPLKVSCELGGWKSPETLLECYQQPDEVEMRQAINDRRRASGETQ